MLGLILQIDRVPARCSFVGVLRSAPLRRVRWTAPLFRRKVERRARTRIWANRPVDPPFRDCRGGPG